MIAFFTSERPPVRPSYLGKISTFLQLACVIGTLIHLPASWPQSWYVLLYLTVGVMVHVMNWMPLFSHVSGGICDPSDTKALIARVVGFAAAGFRAPLPDFGGVK